MRRFFLLCLFFFLACTALCHLQILGFILKIAAKTSTNSLLAYRNLRREGTTLLLEDAVLFDIKGGKSSYFLSSEEISVKTVWQWPLSFIVHVQKPRIIISPDYFKNSDLPASKSHIQWSVELEEGLLEWADNTIPSSQFSLVVTSDELLEMGMSWEMGVLEVKKNRELCTSTWSELSFDVLMKYFAGNGISLPFSNVLGSWSGHADMDLKEGKIVLTAHGEDLLFEWEKMQCEGTLAFEGVWKDSSIEKIRASLKEGRFSSISEIQKVDALMTYQAGLGLKCEGKGVAAKGSLEMPIEWEGKSFFSFGKLDWATGHCRVGKLLGDFSWSDFEGLLTWTQLGVDEAALLQGFTAHLVPGIQDWIWHEGTVRGSIALESDRFTPHLISLRADDLRVEAGEIVLDAKAAFYKAGEWEVEAFKLQQSAAEQRLLEGDAKWRMEFQDNSVALEGDLAGVHFAGNLEWDEEAFSLSIPQIEGQIPLSLWPNIRGQIVAEDGGFKLRGSSAGIEEWKLRCRVFDGYASFANCTLSNFGFRFMADADSIDFLSAQGCFSLAIGEHLFTASFFSPRIQRQRDRSFFDLRLQAGATDLLRLKGGQEGDRIQLDPIYSHLLGNPLFLQNGVWKEGALSAFDFEMEANWPLLESSLRQLSNDMPNVIQKLETSNWLPLPNLEKIHFSSYLTDQELGFTLTSADWKLWAKNKHSQWSLELSIGPYRFDCPLNYKEGIVYAEHGRLKGPGIVCDLEGKIDRKLEGSITLRNLQADCHQFSLDRKIGQLKGAIEGQAEVRFTKKEIESDLDLVVKDLVFEGYSLENMGPLHIDYSSLRGALAKGFDCRIHKENLEGHVKIDLLQFDKKQNRWSAKKAKTHLPSECISFLDGGGNIDCLVDFSFAADLSDWSCVVKEAFLPIGGSIRHIKNLHSFSNGSSLAADALFHYKGKWAKASIDVVLADPRMPLLEGPLRGRLSVQELTQKISDPPLTLDWSYQRESGLLIHSIDGSFAGVNASFHALEKGRLIGSSRLDFRHLSGWIPEDIAKSFAELKMGKGYELKGHLQIDPHDLSNVSFQGIFSGKQIELAGFQFRTLLARADLSSSFIHIYDLKISDSAGLLKIEDLRIQKRPDLPWTIEMPKFIIEELRPSLLLKPGCDVGSISPLVVRQFKLLGLHGILDDGKTYRASGDLSFINSFKRGQTVFDLPAHVFGRIIGLDLELLIPVEGVLTFELSDGYFNLSELKGAYSEGKRSEFFLVQSESEWPRMDLDGNLEILVKMKQFVLFSLTEAFMISIDGNLSDPHFRLQKKKRFL